MSILESTSHRPWLLPQGSWIMAQTWHNLLFAHWPVPVSALRSVVPSQLEIDTCDGVGWLGVVAFRLSGIRLRGLPEVSLVSHFPEVNVRTYVHAEGKPGVFFMSLDADNPLAIAIAKPWFRLNYLNAQIHFQKEGSTITISSRRKQRHAPESELDVTYRPCSPPHRAKPGSLEHWLTERYCYYSVGRRGRVYRCEVHHPEWQLQRAKAEIRANTMALSHGITLPEREPLLHYAHCMKAVIWPVRKLKAGRVFSCRPRLAAEQPGSAYAALSADRSADRGG